MSNKNRVKINKLLKYDLTYNSLLAYLILIIIEDYQ